MVEQSHSNSERWDLCVVNTLIRIYILDNGGATALLFEDECCSSSEPKQTQ